MCLVTVSRDETGSIAIDLPAGA